MSVNPTGPHPTADISLSDGTTTLELNLCNRRGERDERSFQVSNNPRTALRISQGGGGYDEMEMPFTTLVQDDYSGGRGNKYFEKDKTRYADALRADTLRGNLRCGPLATQGTAYYNSETTTTASGSDTLPDATGGIDKLRYASFTPATDITARAILMRLKCTPAAGYEIGQGVSVQLYSNADGHPDSAIAGALGSVLVNSADSEMREYTFALNTPAALAAGVKYWIELSSGAGTAVYEYGPQTGEAICKYAPTITTIHADAAIVFSIKTSGLQGRFFMFSYKGMTCAVTAPEDGTAPRLYVNGYYGYAISNASDKTKLNTSLTLGESTDLKGKIVKICEGQGREEAQNWRVITGNTTGANAVLSVSPPWNIAHDTGSLFYILGCNEWSEVSGHGLTKAVSDVLVVDKTVYFCQGESEAARRATYNAGSWLFAEETDGSNKNMPTFLELIQDDKGKQKIWMAKATQAELWDADAKAWDASNAGTLAFTNNKVVCGSTAYRITGLIGAKMGGAMLPTVMKEEGFGAVSGSGADKIFDWYRKYEEVASEDNGVAVLVQGVYLWFNLGEWLERYYDNILDDKGPNRDEGLPKERRGKVSALLEYTSRIYAAIDGGQYGTSCVLCFNGVGWSEVYRGAYGRRIRSLHIQVIPGQATADRLWIGEGEDLYWIPLASNPEQQSDYRYYSGTQLTTSRIYAQFRDIKKYWAKIALFTEGVHGHAEFGNGQTIRIERRVDGGAWYTIGFATTDNQEFDIGLLIDTLGPDVTGRYLEFRFTLFTDDPLKTPVIESYRVDAVVRTPVKQVVNLTVIIEDGYQVDRNGMRINLSVSSINAILTGWQNSETTPQRLTLSSNSAITSGLKGFIDGGSLAPIEFVVDRTTHKMKAITSFQFVVA